MGFLTGCFVHGLIGLVGVIVYLSVQDGKKKKLRDKFRYNSNGLANIATSNLFSWIVFDDKYRLPVREKLNDAGGQFTSKTAEQACRSVMGNKTPDGHILDDVNWDEIAEILKE